MQKLPKLIGPNLAHKCRPVVYANRLNVIWISVLYRRRRAKNAEISQVWPNFQILADLLPMPFINPDQIWQKTVDAWPMLTCQISFESIYCVTFLGWKTTISGQRWHLEGSCTQPLYHEGQIWYGLLLCAKFRLNRFIWLHSARIWPFLHFGILRCLSWWRTEKVECECTTTNLLLFNGIKIVSVFQCLQNKIVCINYVVHQSDVTKHNGQQTDKKLYYLVAMAVGKVQVPPNLAWWLRTSSMFLHL